MRTLVKNERYCREAGGTVIVEEIYELEGTCTCQIDTKLLSWRCLSDADCPALKSCPLFGEYAGAGEKSQLDR